MSKLVLKDIDITKDSEIINSFLKSLKERNFPTLEAGELAMMYFHRYLFREGEINTSARNVQEYYNRSDEIEKGKKYSGQYIRYSLENNKELLVVHNREFDKEGFENPLSYTIRIKDE